MNTVNSFGSTLNTKLVTPLWDWMNRHKMFCIFWSGVLIDFWANFLLRHWDTSLVAIIK